MAFDARALPPAKHIHVPARFRLKPRLSFGNARSATLLRNLVRYIARVPDATLGPWLEVCPEMVEE
jgi:hypothetical protein